jgi:hypothetical protein
MMHNGMDALDADASIRGFAIPQPSTQPFDFIDDHSIRRCPCRIIDLHSGDDLRQMVHSHSDVEPVEHRRRRGTGVAEDTAVQDSHQ